MALLTLSLVHKSEGLVPVKTALNGSAQVPGTFFWKGNVSVRGSRWGENSAPLSILVPLREPRGRRRDEKMR